MFISLHKLIVSMIKKLMIVSHNFSVIYILLRENYSLVIGNKINQKK